MNNTKRNTACIKVNPNVVTRRIGKETILMPLFSSSDEIDCIYVLNDVASRVWKLLEEETPFTRMKEIIQDEFDTNDLEVKKELNTFIRNLKSIKAVE